MAARSARRSGLWAGWRCGRWSGSCSCGASPACSSEPRQDGSTAADRSSAADPATAAFAVGSRGPTSRTPRRRRWLHISHRAPRRRLLAGTGAVAQVEQAEVAAVRDLGDRQAIVTVACELDDARTLYLAVPIVREDAAEVAALGVPAVVAGPAGVGASVEPPRPVAGPDAGAIAELVRRFLPAYLSAASPGDLSYLLAPGAAVTPPGGGFELVAVASVKQVGSGEGARRTVIATARVRDAASGAVVPLAYRLAARPAGPLVRRAGRRGALVSRRLAVALALVVVLAAALWLAPEALAAGGNDVGRNIGAELRRWAGSIYGGLLAIVGLVFLLNRKFTDLAVFLLAAILVGWLVFSPDQVADAARAIGNRILP